MHALRDIRSRSVELAATPGFSGLRAMKAIYWRVWLGIAVGVSLGLVSTIVLGWRTPLPQATGYFGAMVTIAVTLSTPSRLRTRAQEGMGSLWRFASAWKAYLFGLAAWLIVGLGVLIGTKDGWTESAVVGAAAAVLVIDTTLSMEPRYKAELWAAVRRNTAATQD